MGKLQLITKGLIKENPTFVLLLGMCPTLATTTSAVNGMSMGLATMFVLILSNMVISAIAAYIPDKVRIPSYIRDFASVCDAGLCTRCVRDPRSVHSAYRCELYRAWTC